MKHLTSFIFDVFLICLFFMGVIFFIAGREPASTAELQEVIAQAETSAAAKSVLKDALTENPQPTVTELSRIKDTVTSARNQEVAAQFTGSGHRPAVSESQKASAAADEKSWAFLKIMLALSSLVLAVMIVFRVLRVLRD